MDPNLLIGMDRPDDAGVYKISEDLAIIQTVDFFTPIVDDPYSFGQIAVANALSDVYAMGGEPKTAMNLVGFPIKTMDLSILRQIIEGGLDKMKEADVVLVGGHSVEDNELKYGLSVTGFIHPDKLWSKHHLKTGDILILTKSIGTGIINTAIKGGLASEAIINKTVESMSKLNRQAAEVMKAYPVNACTDITGFGLLGHIAEMLIGSGLSIQLESKSIPIIKEAIEFGSMGLFPAGAYKNKDFRSSMVVYSENVDYIIGDILFDPQTSGGLLFCIDEDYADRAISDLVSNGCRESSVIGNVISDNSEKIFVVS